MRFNTIDTCDGANIKLTSVLRQMSKNSPAPGRSFPMSLTCAQRFYKEATEPEKSFI